MKLHHVVSIGLGLKGVKIARNIAKVGVHACLSNMHPNLWSSFNYENLVKAETASCSFVRVFLKDVENSSQHRESWHAILFSKCGFKSMIKNVKLRCAVLLRLGLNGVKIFWNVSKVCMHACWSNWHRNLWSNLNSKKLLESETPSCGFDRVGLNGSK